MTRWIEQIIIASVARQLFRFHYEPWIVWQSSTLAAMYDVMSSVGVTELNKLAARLSGRPGDSRALPLIDNLSSYPVRTKAPRAS